MVLALHANFSAIGQPSSEILFSVSGSFRVFMEALCFVSVNTFVMISGYFGIKASLKGFCNFMWQVIYIVGILFIVGVLYFDVPFNIKIVSAMLGLYGGGGWFVASYIGLYILSPVLNAYVRTTSGKEIAMMLVGFFCFEFIWGNTNSVPFIEGGYSTFSFIGVYVFAGLLRKYKDQQNGILKYLGARTFLLTAFLNTLIYIVAYRRQWLALQSSTLNYINPLVLIGAASLLITFVRHALFLGKIRFIHNSILWLASSCFAVYLLHVGMSWAFNTYCAGVKCIYNAFSGFTLIGIILAYVLGVFTLAIIIDQPRKYIWNKFISRLFDRK